MSPFLKAALIGICSAAAGAGIVLGYSIFRTIHA